MASSAKGEGVNIGAGTIFCNYDGGQKHVTTLEDGVFISSSAAIRNWWRR